MAEDTTPFHSSNQNGLRSDSSLTFMIQNQNGQRSASVERAEARAQQRALLRARARAGTWTKSPRIEFQAAKLKVWTPTN